MKKLLVFLTIVMYNLLSFLQSAAQAPTITSFSPASGSVGTLVTITGTNLTTPTAFNIGGVSAIRVSGSATSLVGMVMPGATTGTVSVTTASGSVTGSSNFTVTATPAPNRQQGNKLVGTGNTGGVQQGTAVAVSADGNTAIVGGPLDNGTQGAAWIYTRTGSTWTQQGSKLVGTGNVGGSQQGYAVDISADGNTAIVGGYTDNNNVGASWVFTRSGSTWSQQGTKLVGTGGIGAQQGSSVSISADGNTAIVGGKADNNNIGAVWVFIRTGTTWSQQGNKLVGTGNTGAAQQGYSVSIAANGNTAIVGGNLDNSEQGAAWIFTRSGSTWSQQGTKLLGTANAGAAQRGYSVGISADGNTAIVGGAFDNNLLGAAWIFTRSGTTWSQQGSKLVGSGPIAGAVIFQGWSVAISADGNTCMLGGPIDGSDIGGAWVFSRTGSTWSQQGSKLVGTGNIGSSRQGWSVALSADATTALIGGNIDNSNRGAAWVYVYAPPPSITSFSPANGSVGSLVTINGTNLGDPTAITIGGTTAIVVSNTGTQLVAMVMPGATTGAVSVTTNGGTANGTGNFTVTTTPFPSLQQGGKLVGTGNTGTGSQGWSVAIAADGNTAIVGAQGDNNNQGAVWIYTRSGSTWTQQGNKLVGSGNTGAAQQGWSVAIAADGNTAIVGGYNDNGGVGAAWVFTRSGSTWSQQGSKLVGTGSVGGSQQGFSVGISADGNTAIVCGNRDNSAQGAGWVFVRSGTTWTQQGSKLVGTGVAGLPLMGFSVALSADGNTAILGGTDDNNFMGAAWVFNRSGSTWSQQGSKLVGTSAGGSLQGQSVAISADGNTAMIGGYNDNGGQGAAWIFTRSGSTWSQQGSKLVGTGTVGTSAQGRSVALSADGNTAMVGGGSDNSTQGAIWVFTRNGSTWSQQGNKLVGTGNTGAAQQGRALAISANGSTAITGGINDNNSVGASWMYTISQTPTIIGTATTAAFSTTYGTASAVQTIAVGGFNLTANLVATAPSGFEVSSDGTTYGSTATFTLASGSANGTLRIRLAATATVAGSYNAQNIVLSSTGATSTNITTPATGNAVTARGIIGSFTTSNKIYDGNNNATVGARNLSGVLPADAANVILTGGTATFNNANVGNGKTVTLTGATITGSAIGNYSLTSVSTTTANITALGITGSFIANSKLFDGNNIATVLTRSLSGVLSGDAANVNLSGGTATFSDANVGNNKTVTLTGATLTGTASGNYSLTSVSPTTANITAPPPPTITGFTPATGAVGTLVTITGTNLSTPISFTIGGTTAIVVSTTGTQLVAMVMPGATTGSVSFTTAGGSASGASNFTTTATPFPNLQQGNKLVGTGNTGLAVQGASLAISADGNTAIVGGYADNSDQGAAWIYTRTGSTWTQQGNKLVGTGNTGAARQGISVAISADGNTAIVGGNQDNTNQGATWVFTRSGNTWSQQGSKLVGTGNTGAASQGTSVALSADGNTAIVGGIGDNGNIGATWVFTRSGSTWSQQGNKLVGSGNTGAARQGTYVAISADGNTVISGGWSDNSNQGATWVFTRSGSTWSQQGGKLVGTGNAGAAQQGFSVALSANGNTAIIGGWTDNSNQGAAWVFTRSGTTWSQQGSKLVGTGNVGAAQQGIRVALSADGNTAIIGGRLDNSNIGASWVFTRSGSTWSQRGSKLVGTGNVGAPLQSTVAISADGTTALVGGGSDNGGAGAAWVFIPGPAITGAATATAFTTTYGTASAVQTFAVSGANLSANIVATAPTGFEVSSDGTTFSSTATFIQTGGAASGTLRIRLAATATVGGTYNAQNIVLSSTGAANVNITTAATGNAVNAASITIAPTGGQSKTYGAADPTFTYNASPSITISGALSRAVGQNVGTYAYTLGTLSAGSNYTLSLSGSSTFAITPAPLTITGITANNKNYDGNTSATLSGTASYVGLQNSESFTVTGTPIATFNTANAGTAKPVNVVGYTAPTANYTISQPTLTANIIGLPIATANFRSKNSGNFSSIATWQYDQGGNDYVDATQVPNGNNNINIQNGHIVNLDVNFTINSGKTVALTASSALVINPTSRLTIVGTADFNNQSVTLQSTAAGTASIGQITGSLLGATNVTVERYIPANTLRAWRLLAVPTKGSQTIQQAWQEGQAQLVNGTPGYGTIITSNISSSAGLLGAGFDAFSTAPSLQYYGTNAWINATSTNTPIESDKAYFIFIRGSRAVTPSVSNTVVDATTLRTTGTLYQGTVTVNTAGSFTPIANVYASSVDFTQLTRSGVSNTYYLWDAKKASGVLLGAYQTFSGTNGFQCIPGGGSFTPNQVNTTIQSGQGFFVSGVGSITFNESAKVSGSSLAGYRPATPVSALVKIDSRLYNSSNTLVDANVVVFNNNYANAVDGDDAVKYSNSSENFGIVTNNTNLAVEGRKPITADDVINFSVSNLKEQTYTVEFTAANMSNSNLEAQLVDKYLGTSTPVDVTGVTKVSFTVNADAASKAANRFSLVFKAKATVPAITKARIVVSPNPVEGSNMNLQFANQAAGKYTVRILNLQGKAITTALINHTGGSSNQVISLSNKVAAGMYKVEIISADKTRTVQTVFIQ